MNYTAENEKLIAGLHPILQPLCRAHLAGMDRAGHPCAIKEGMRTFEYQARLYAKGRTAPGKKVTNAKAGQSNHNYGCAYDIVPIELLPTKDWSPASPIWRIVQERGSAIIGLMSLYEVMGWDLPHFQLNIPLTRKTSNCLAIFRKTGMRGVWGEVTKQFTARFGVKPVAPIAPVEPAVAPPSSAPITSTATPTPATEASADGFSFDDVASHISTDSAKRIAGKASAKIGSLAISAWGLGVHGQILVILIAALVIGVGGFELYKHWPRVKAFAIRRIKGNGNEQVA